MTKQETLASAKNILSELVSFESISGISNLEMIAYIRAYLENLGIESSISYDDTGERANLFASIGPRVAGGVLLNGHTDVVPVVGQSWSDDPFQLVERDGRLYGRGSVDMKGFLACMLAMAPVFQDHDLKTPILISFCFDEEIGGYGAPILAKDILDKDIKPRAAIVGEPTGMQLICGHKAGLEMRTEFVASEVHSSNPSKGVNAIEYASLYVAKIIEIGKRLAAAPVADCPFEPPYTTFNVGTISGGAARNITAGSCAMDWEIRPLPEEDVCAIIEEIDDYANNVLLPEMRKTAPLAQINTIREAYVPALHAAPDSPAVILLRQLTGSNSSNVVAFGTDAGHFQAVGISTVVYGPGSIDQAHKPDEFIEVSQLERCLGFLHQLARHQAH